MGFALPHESVQSCGEGAIAAHRFAAIIRLEETADGECDILQGTSAPHQAEVASRRERACCGRALEQRQGRTGGVRLESQRLAEVADAYGTQLNPCVTELGLVGGELQLEPITHPVGKLALGAQACAADLGAALEAQGRVAFQVVRGEKRAIEHQSPAQLDPIRKRVRTRLDGRGSYGVLRGVHNGRAGCHDGGCRELCDHSGAPEAGQARRR